MNERKKGQLLKLSNWLFWYFLIYNFVFFDFAFISCRGSICSRQQLMEKVWTGVVVTGRTVDVNITRLRKKLGPYAHCIANKQGLGYYFDDKSEQ